LREETIPALEMEWTTADGGLGVQEGVGQGQDLLGGLRIERAGHQAIRSLFVVVLPRIANCRNMPLNWGFALQPCPPMPAIPRRSS
jgi:hypothetical protein